MRWSVDLFAGCGGLSLGLEQAGFQTALVNELSPEAMESFLMNRDVSNPLLRSKYSVRDVKELVLDPNVITDLISGFKDDYGFDASKGELDLVVGGPPCQGFSGMGHRRSYSVEKQQLPSNYLFQDMAYVISRLRPKAFLFENVRGLLNAKWSKDGTKGEIWQEVQDTFAGIPGYVTEAKLVFAKDYGVPQNRPRVLLVGFREDVAFPGIRFHPEGGIVPPTIPELLGDLMDPEYVNGGATEVYPSEIQNDFQRELRRHGGGYYAKGDPLTEQEYTFHSDKVLERYSYMVEHDGEILDSMRTKKFSQRMLPREWDDGGPCITACTQPNDYVHYGQPRELTVREWARLQTFPDHYRFAGKRMTGGIRRAGNPREGIFDRETPKYTQIGNAVPVALARAVGENLAAML